MIKRLTGMLALLAAVLVIPKATTAQAGPKPNMAAKRIEVMTKVESRLIYPLIKGSVVTGVLPVDNPENTLPAGQVIKLIFDFTQVTANKAQGSHINEGLEEVARTMNLHIAAGVKKENLKTVIILHSGALKTVQNNAYYQKNFGNDNPNLSMLNLLLKAGTEVVVCGQSMQFNGFEAKDLVPGVQMSFSAKTTLSKYQTMGYVVFPIDEAD